MLRVDVAGCDITGYLMKLMEEQNHKIGDREIIRDIKERYAYVPLENQSEIKDETKEQVLFKVILIWNVLTFFSQPTNCQMAKYSPLETSVCAVLYIFLFIIL
jgi:hypothetical protein